MKVVSGLQGNALGRSDVCVLIKGFPGAIFDVAHSGLTIVILMLLGLDGHSAVLGSNLLMVVDAAVDSAHQHSFRCRDATIVSNIADNLAIIIQLSLIDFATSQSHAAGPGFHVTIVYQITLISNELNLVLGGDVAILIFLSTIVQILVGVQPYIALLGNNVAGVVQIGLPRIQMHLFHRGNIATVI